MLLVDTNVLEAVLQNDPQWADGSIAPTRAQAKLHVLAIDPVIYAEMSLPFSTLEALDDVVLTMALEMREIPRPALFLAAKACGQYRRRGGSKGAGAARLLHRCPRCRRGLVLADSGRQPLQDLLPDASGHDPLRRRPRRRFGRRHESTLQGRGASDCHGSRCWARRLEGRSPGLRLIERLLSALVQQAIPAKC